MNILLFEGFPTNTHTLDQPSIWVPSGGISQSQETIVNKWNYNANLTTVTQQKRLYMINFTDKNKHVPGLNELLHQLVSFS